MSNKYLEYLLKIKISELFGTLPITIKNNINFIAFKNVIPETKNHHNNLIGKVSCKKFIFYYIPLQVIENYENNAIGIPICNDILVCPFCFGIQLPIEEQSKLYDMLNMNNLEGDISNETNQINDIQEYIRSKYCFEMLNSV